MRLLIKLPSRSRPEKLVSITKKYIDFAEDKTRIRFIISLDTDDPTATPELQKELANIHACIQVCMGKSTSKIDAVNRDIPDPQTFDILLLASDDMVPQTKGYDTIIRQKMLQYYPDTDGVLFFNDGYNGKKLNTLSIMGSKYYRRFGYIYYPEYKSFYCDNEFMDTATRLKKQMYFNQTIIKHVHPVNGSSTNDALYIRNNVYVDLDKQLYLKRKRSQTIRNVLPFLYAGRR